MQLVAPTGFMLPHWGHFFWAATSVSVMMEDLRHRPT
jgi:hypothetical protein